MSTRRFDVAAIAALTVAVSVSVVAAAPPAVVDVAGVRSVRVGDVITLDRPGAAAVARVRSAEVTGADGRVIVADRLDGHGHVVLAARGEDVAGYVTGAGGTSRVRIGAKGEATYAAAANGFSCTVNGAPTFGRQDGLVEAGAGCAPQGLFHDLLVVYTEGVETALGGEAATLAEIDALVALSNQALVNSQTTPVFRLALAWKIDASDSTSLGELNDPSDGVADEAHVLRDLVAADQVIMLFDGGGGVANGVWALDPAQEANAFNLSGIGSFPYVFPHEIGHNMGCCHAFGDGGGCPGGGGLLFPYSNGYRWFGDSGTEWRTIMAYAPGERTSQFSNPNVSFDGQVTGTVDADNALTMQLSADLVANFRCAEDAVCGDLSDPAARADCNENGFPDGCDIGSGASADVNGNGVPDECESCTADLAGPGGIPDGNVDALDYLLLIGEWGSPCTSCTSDITGPAGTPDGNVDSLDFLVLIGQWGTPGNCGP